MFKLHVVQACFGDCFILQYGSKANPEYVLIDGGPKTVYENHLRPVLVQINDSGGRLDHAILSHVDDDHIVGLLALITELWQQRNERKAETIGLKVLWYNTFSQLTGPDVETQFKKIRGSVGMSRGATKASAGIERDIAKGDALTHGAGLLGIAINPEFTPHHLVCVDDTPTAIPLGALQLRVVGPTQKHLEALRKAWLKWLAMQEKRAQTRAVTKVKEDESTPNLSSIMVIAESEGKTVLLSGDGSAADLVSGLKQAKLLGPDQKLHVNVFKLAHHGSVRNATPELFHQITADTYVVSANGRDDNPDYDVLKWVVTAAKDDRRSIELIVTNETDSTRRLEKKCPPGTYGYKLTLLKPGEHSLAIELAA